MTSDAPEQTEKTRPVWLELFDLNRANPKREEIQDIISREMRARFGDEPLLQEYNVRLLMDSRSIGPTDSDQIYQSFKDVDRSKPVLLIVKSGGGSISAAFFVAKVCRESTDAEFSIAVPREAKSAATLICCGADRIHMGSLSELGPIDPQFGSTPALALKNSVEHLAELAARYPGAAAMFSEYLARTLRVESLGYYERVAASAVQYAVRLLRSRAIPAQTEPELETLAKHLVYNYKDHGFVIDSREAIELFGATVIASNTPEYEFANRIYDHIDFLNYFVGQALGRELSFAGVFDRCNPFRLAVDSSPT
jgi:hypothetical protein